MLIRIAKTTAAAAIAGALLYIVTPLVPSMLFIQQVENEVIGDQWTFVRTVTLPNTTGEFQWEINRGGEEICSNDGVLAYEQRGSEPLIFDLSREGRCGDRLAEEGRYTLRHCISVIGPFSIRLYPTCTVTKFGEPIIARYELEQRALEAKIEELETVIEERLK